MQVIVKPVDTTKWHGKNGKESFARPHTIEVLYDPSTGKYATGLTPEETAQYSQRLGLDLSDTFNYEKPHPYWGSNAAKIKLPNHTMVLETTKDTDFIKIKNLKASKFVANSLQEQEDGKWPEATHVIFDESEEVELEATKIQKKNKCILVMSKMSSDEKINLVRIISDKSIKDRSQNFIDVELNKILENKDQIDDFIKYASMGKAEVTTRAQIVEAVHRHILTKEGNSIFYMGEKLGFDYEEVVKYFMHPDNQQIKVAILEKILD